MAFLRTSFLGTESLLDLLLEKDQSEDPPEELIDILTEQANSLEFFNFVTAKAGAHFELLSKLFELRSDRQMERGVRLGWYDGVD